MEPHLNVRDEFEPYEFEIEAHPANAASARERVRALAARAGFSGVALGDIEIAVGEAVTNAILYGSPTPSSRIVVACGLTGNTFSVEIRDQGHGFDPHQVQPAEDSDALGGRGLRLMRALLDRVDLHYDGGGMVARLSKYLP